MYFSNNFLKFHSDLKMWLTLPEFDFYFIFYNASVEPHFKSTFSVSFIYYYFNEFQVIPMSIVGFLSLIE